MIEEVYKHRKQHASISTDAENLLLGSVLLNPAITIECAAYVSGSDFVQLAYGRTFDHLHRMAQAGEPVCDNSLVCRSLKAAGLLGDDGNKNVISLGEYARLCNNLPNAAHGIYHANAVASAARLRRVRSVGFSILADTDTLDPNLDEPSARTVAVTKYLSLY